MKQLGLIIEVIAKVPEERFQLNLIVQWLKQTAVTSLSKTTFPYLTTVVGVVIVAAAQVWNYVRLAMFMAAMQSGGYGSYSGPRHFRGGFGGPSIITTIGVVVAVIGVIWLGLTLRKS